MSASNGISSPSCNALIIFNDKPKAVDLLIQLLQVKEENVIQQPDPDQPADIQVILGEDYDPCR